MPFSFMSRTMLQMGAMPLPPAMQMMGASVSDEVEEAVGPGEEELVAFLQMLEHPGGADAVGHQADDQFDVPGVGGHRGDGIGAHDGVVPLVFGRLELDVLAGLERDRVGLEQFHAQFDDVVGERFLVFHPRPEAADGEQLLGDLDAADPCAP